MDEQINSILATTIMRPIDDVDGGIGEMIKNDSKAKTLLEFQINALCSKIRNSKQPQPSGDWVESIFDNVESLLGKDKVLGNLIIYGIFDL